MSDQPLNVFALLTRSPDEVPQDMRAAVTDDELHALADEVLRARGLIDKDAPGAWVREAERLGRELARTIRHGLGDAAAHIGHPNIGMGDAFKMIALRSTGQSESLCPSVVSTLAGIAEVAFLAEWEKSA